MNKNTPEDSGVFLLHSVFSWGMMTVVIRMLKLLWTNSEQTRIPADLPLSEYRKKKLALLKPPLARHCSLCAELLLNETLRREQESFKLPADVETDAYGKPYLVGREYEFSLSHSGSYAACALSDAEIGLDIQILSKCDERLVRRFFTEKEQEAIFRAEDRDAAFTRLWCRKESFFKAIGTGLRLPLDAYNVSAEQCQLSYRDTVYGFREFRTDDLFFCVCLPSDKLPPEIEPEYIELP